MKLFLLVALIFVTVVVSHSLNLNHLAKESESEIKLRFFETKSCSGYHISCPIGCCSVNGAYVAGLKTGSIKTEITSSGARITRYDRSGCQGNNGYFNFKINQCYFPLNGSPMLHYQGVSYFGSSVILANSEENTAALSK
eukprot:gene10253-2672_t